MKKVSDVFKSIRFAKAEPRDKPHSSTDDEGHYTVGEKEFNQQLKHVKKMAMQEEKKDVYDEGEYDREGDMAKSDLRSIIANAKRLHDMIGDADNLPEWCQNKITLAEDYISTVANYMTAEMNEEVQYIEEKNAPTNPELWSRAKALAKSKFDVYPSAYANGWAAKWYKSKGGGWKTVSEEVVAEASKQKLMIGSKVTHPDHGKGTVIVTSRGGGNMGTVVKFANGKKVKVDHKKLIIKEEGVAEEVEQLDEMPGANMDTRAVHAHLKKKGWKLSRTSGSHDVFTHSDAEHHIAVPRHRQLKAPLIKGILKQSNVNEEIDLDDQIIENALVKVLSTEGYEDHHKFPDYMQKILKKYEASPEEKAANAKKAAELRANAPARPPEKTKPYKPLGGYDEKSGRSYSEQVEYFEEAKDDVPFDKPYKKDSGTTTDKSGAKHSAMSKVKHLAKQAMKKQTEKLKKPRLEEEKDEEMSEKTKIVRDALKTGKKKLDDKDKTAGGKDKFEPEPELTSQIVKT